jgi:putative membrane protein
MMAMMFWYDGGWAWWQASLMWAAMIVIWGLLIWGGYALITSATRKESRAGGDARSVLDERLARGEIDAEEYRRLRNLISSDVTRPRVGSGTGS